MLPQRIRICGGAQWMCLLVCLLLLSGLSHQSPLFSAEESDTETSETSQEEDELVSTTQLPQTADQLGVPRCESDYDCVYGGTCRKDPEGNYGRCLCPSSCPSYIPNKCTIQQAGSCMAMDKNYTTRFNLGNAVCLKNICVCPPMFDDIVKPKFGKLPPVKCDKRELKIVGFIKPAHAVYKGNDVTMYCCTNIDPNGVVDASGMYLVHNSSVTKDASTHPYMNLDFAQVPYIEDPCWTLEVKNVQFSDSGTYMCIASHKDRTLPQASFTMDFEVKEIDNGDAWPLPPHIIRYFRRSKKGNGPIRLKSRTHSELPMIHNLAVTPNATEANVTWEIDADSKLQIDLRLVANRHQSEVWKKTNATSPLIIPKLKPASSYTLHITVRGGPEVMSTTRHFNTLETVPETPRLEALRLIHDDRSAGSVYCEVEWKPPAVANGIIKAYYVRVEGKVREGGDTLIPDHFPPATDNGCANFHSDDATDLKVNPIEFPAMYFICKFGPLKPNRNYSVTIWSENRAGRSIPVTFAQQCSTDYAPPDYVDTPTTVVPAATNLTSFALRFQKPSAETNGPITCYYVAVVPMLHNVSLDSLISPDTIVVDSSAVVYANNLKTAVGDNVTHAHFAYIAESYSKVLPDEAIIGDGNTTSGVKPCMLTYLSRHSTEDVALRTGIKYTGFLIVRVDAARPRTVLVPSTPAPSRRKFTYSKATKNNRYRSVRQVISGASYAYSAYFKPVYLRVPNEDGSWTPILLVLGLLIVFALVAGASFAYFTFINGKKMSSEHIPLKMSSYGPVAADELPSEYRDRHKDTDFLFAQEFEKLPHYQHECTASNRKENAPKNRYNDIRAFDSTRVRLKKIDGDENSDYINANFIAGYDPRKRFIAAQGPLAGTVADFWRMCWEEDVHIVVMVANLVEKTRQQCAKYWPDEKEPLTVGGLTLRQCAVEYYADYAVRHLEIREDNKGPKLSPISIPVNRPRSVTDLSGSDEWNGGASEYANLPTTSPVSNGTELPASGNARRIVQYHFTNWNDYKAPECVTGLLRFLHLLRATPEFSSTPVVVHCSAGVGRTGTLIAIDSMLDQYEKEGKVDVFSFVSKMRMQRNLMVQSLEQYTFVYKALAEWHLFGPSDLDEKAFLEHYDQLLEPAPGRSRRNSDLSLASTSMQLEFEKTLEELEVRHSTKFANETSNLNKNRYSSSVPFDRNRVCLQPLIGYADSSYINASHVKGYFYPFILSQDPIDESTCFDFWRMVSEQRVTCIVVLSRQQQFKPEEKYWPEDHSAPRMFTRESQSVRVSLLSEEQEPTSTHTLRRLEYHIKNDAKPRTVSQFCCECWPEGGLPISTEKFLRFIGRVLEKQSSHRDTGPILLHCRDGSSESAVFCAICILMERLKAEHRIDVLQTVRGIRAQRMHTFSTTEQYAFCYQAVAEYLRR